MVHSPVFNDKPCTHAARARTHMFYILCPRHRSLLSHSYRHRACTPLRPSDTKPVPVTCTPLARRPPRKRAPHTDPPIHPLVPRPELQRDQRLAIRGVSISWWCPLHSLGRCHTPVALCGHRRRSQFCQQGSAAREGGRTPSTWAPRWGSGAFQTQCRGLKSASGS